MKGAVIDLLFPIGHKNLNENIVLNLSEISKLTVITVDNYFNDNLEMFEEIELMNIKKTKERSNVFLSRIYSLRNFAKINKLIHWKKYDYIFINTFETITFSIIRKFIKNKKIFIVHHNNTDELKNKIKRYFFNYYKNNVHHVVFEDFIKDYLVGEIGVLEELVYVIPHPLSPKDSSSSNQEVRNNLCVGLSNSNDPALISEILEYEDDFKTFSNNNLSLVLKSQSEESDKGTIKLLKGFIPKIDYDKYINESKFVIIPFKSTYNFRTSGVIIDALSSGKIVVGNNIPLVNSYSLRYPNICYKFENVNEIPQILLNENHQNHNKLQTEFEYFLQQHSDSEIVIKLKSMIYN